MPPTRLSQLEFEQLFGAKRPTSITEQEVRRSARNQSKQHSELVNSCLEWLEWHRVLCWKQHVGRVRIGTRWINFGVAGQPDILGAHPGRAAHPRIERGRMFGLEIKTGNAVQREAQKEMQHRFTIAGGLYLVVRSIRDLDQWF